MLSGLYRREVSEEAAQPWLFPRLVPYQNMGVEQKKCVCEFACRSAERLARRREGGETTQTVANSAVADWQKELECV